MNSIKIDRILTAAAAFSITLLMFGPILAVSIYIATPSTALADGTAEATVGVGVVLRAVAQRLFRAGARNTVRVTFGTMTRTVARTMTTRLIRIFFRSLVGSAVKDLMDGNRETESTKTATVSIGAVLVGMIATAVSFWGVLIFADQNSVAAFKTEMKLSLPLSLVGAAIPLMFLALICQLSAYLFVTKSVFTTGIEGIFIQAYFTISGSFLPMTTDFAFQGNQSRCAMASTFTLLVMLAVFAALRAIGVYGDNDFSVYLSAMFLTYAFVYSFPLRPLLGNCIWVHSKWMWLLTFALILLAFVLAFPVAVAALL